MSWPTASEVGRALPRPRGRPGWSTGPRGRTASRTGPRHRWSARSCTCAGSSGSARSRSATGWGCRPRRCTRCWSAAGSTGSPTSTGPPVNRSAATSTTTPGDLIHVDVKKLGNIPDGGGWRYVGRQQGDRNRAATAGQATQQAPQPDDRHRVRAHRASTTTPGSPTPRSTTTRPQATAAAVLRHAVAWFADRGVTVERVLSDNGSCYRSHLWRDTCAELGITPKKTRPYRPQTNGKIERFHRTLADGLGLQEVLQLRDPPAAPLCQHGSTSTTTTGPTPPSARPHPSPG